MARVAVLNDEAAERDVVARGVLHAGEHAVDAEADEHVHVELVVDAHGNVVGEEGQVERIVQDSRALRDLVDALERVERAGRHEGVDAHLLGALAVLDHALGLRVDDAREHRHAVVDDADHVLDDLGAALVGREHDLRRRAQDEEAVDASLDHAVDVAFERGHVELTVLGERHHDGRDDAAETLVVHDCSFSCGAGRVPCAPDIWRGFFAAPASHGSAPRMRRRATTGGYTKPLKKGAPTRGRALVLAMPSFKRSRLAWGVAATGRHRAASSCRGPSAR